MIHIQVFMEFSNSSISFKTIIMRRKINQLTLFVFSFLYGTLAWGQNLTPKELNIIHNNSDFPTITSTLTEKGFKLQSNRSDEGTREKVARWYFQPFTHSGEEVSSYLIKSVDSNQKAKTIFFLYNPFHYKDFVNSLITSKYKFIGAQVIDNKNYFGFKNKRTVFMTAEKRNSNNQVYFEILLRTE